MTSSSSTIRMRPRGVAGASGSVSTFGLGMSLTPDGRSAHIIEGKSLQSSVSRGVSVSAMSASMSSTRSAKSFISLKRLKTSVASNSCAMFPHHGVEF